MHVVSVCVSCMSVYVHDVVVCSYVLGNGKLSTPHNSYGGQLFRIYGMHFGRVDLAWGVRAWYVEGKLLLLPSLLHFPPFLALYLFSLCRIIVAILFSHSITFDVLFLSTPLL
jgi:hypothetical protein